MSLWRQREQARWNGGSEAKLDDSDDDDDRWSLGDDEETDAGSWPPYRKHKWTLVAAWTNIDMEDAYRRVAEIMTKDFNVAGGLRPNKWGESSEMKIGPFCHR